MAVKTFGVSFLASTGCSDAHGLWGNGVWEGGCWCHCAALSFLQLMFFFVALCAILGSVLACYCFGNQQS